MGDRIILKFNMLYRLLPLVYMAAVTMALWPLTKWSPTDPIIVISSLISVFMLLDVLTTRVVLDDRRIRERYYILFTKSINVADIKSVNYSPTLIVTGARSLDIRDDQTSINISDMTFSKPAFSELLSALVRLNPRIDLLGDAKELAQ